MSDPEEQTGAIEGRVLDSHGQPLAWATVMIGGDSPPHVDIAILTEDDGRYAFRGLAPGVYTLLVNAEGYPLESGQTTVAAGAVARLDFNLPA
jgi:hypothetical protein